MNTHRYRYRLLLYLACLGLAFAGCDNTAGCPRTLPDLNIPGVHKVSAISSLRRSGHDIIWSLNAYRRSAEADGSTASQILISLNGQLTALYQDGTDIRRIPTIQPCGLAAVTSDGQWIACSYDSITCGQMDTSSCVTSTIEVASLADSGTPIDHLLIAATPGVLYRSPAWSPDGLELAAISTQGDSCALAVFSTMPPYVHAEMIARLVFPMFQHSGVLDPCGLSTVSWSPDGNWLALATGSQLYLLSVKALPQDIFTEGHALMTVVVTLDQLTLIGGTSLVTPATWMPNASGLTFASVDGRSIQTYVLAQHSAITILSQTQNQPQLQMRALAWLPEENQLLIGIIAPGIVECGTLPSDVYVYSPAINGQGQAQNVSVSLRHV